jgi:alpha-D-ribose 1-methylphosphonate 5-triphosphate synthase subunit PhnL
LVQRNLNKGVLIYIRGRRFGHFLLQPSLSLKELIFHLPPSTYIPIEVARVSIKKGLILSFKGISKVAMLPFK